jgi:hypothetical protein
LSVKSFMPKCLRHDIFRKIPQRTANNYKNAETELAVAKSRLQDSFANMTIRAIGPIARSSNTVEVPAR